MEEPQQEPMSQEVFEEMKDLQEEEGFEGTEDDILNRGSFQDAMGVPEPEQRFNQHVFLSQSIQSDEPEKVTFLSESELGRPLFNLRFLLDIEDICKYYLDDLAKEYKTDVIVRVTSDCPLIDPEVLDKVVKAYLEDPCDYCSNIQPPTYPDGHDVEVIPFTALERAWNDASLMSEREHVTVHLWKNPDKFKLVNIENDEDFSDLRLSVDEKEDFILIEKIIQKINKSPIFLRDIIELFKNEPDLPKINSTFMRNEGQAKSFREDRIVR